jgi:outer membrane protein assembly factor BamB
MPPYPRRPRHARTGLKVPSMPLASFALATLLGLGTLPPCDTIAAYPSTAFARPSTDFTVTVNGLPVFVEEKRHISFVHFSFSGTASIVVTYAKAIKSLELDPLSYGIQPIVNGNTLAFDLSIPRKLVLHHLNNPDPSRVTEPQREKTSRFLTLDLKGYPLRPLPLRPLTRPPGAGAGIRLRSDEVLSLDEGRNEGGTEGHGSAGSSMKESPEEPHMSARCVIPLVGLLIVPFVVASSAISAATIPHPATLQHAASSFIIRNSGSQVNWPQLGFDSGHSAYNPNENIIGAKNAGQLTEAWSFSTGSGNNAGNVVEANGVVYAPSAIGTLYAINASTGQQVWSFASGRGYASSGSAPVYDSGMVFTVCNTSASSQGICALNAADGSLSWSYTYSNSKAYDGTPPVVASGLVFFEACTSSCAYVALHEDTGKLSWRVKEPQGKCEGNGGITPAVYQGYLFVGFTCLGGTNDAIVELNTATGGLVRNLNTQGIVDGQNAGLSVANGVAYVMDFSSNYQWFFADDVAHGAPMYTWFYWQGLSPSMPAISPKYNYEVTSEEIWANKNDGQYLSGLRCRHHLKPWCRPLSVTSWPSVANGVVFAACPGSPCAIDGTSEALLWSGSGAPTYGVPIIVNGVVYAACNGSNVCAWTLPSMIRRRR